MTALWDDGVAQEDECLVVVHRDMGLGFKHDVSGRHCPCCPHIIDPDEFETTEQIDARILEAERRMLS